MRRTPNPKSLKNLRPPWRPGESGNPTGHRKRPLSDAYRDVLDDGDVAAAIARRVIRSALKGNLAAVKEITDRIEGKARQAIDFGIEAEPNYNFTVRFVKSDGNGHPAPEDACESCGGSGTDDTGRENCQACGGSRTRK